MKNWLKTLSPTYIPEHIRAQGDLMIIRERILQLVLLIATIIALPLVIGGVEVALNGGYALVAYLYGVMYAFILLLALSRKWAYEWRSGILVSLLYLLSVNEILQYSPLGDVRVMLLVYVTMSAVLFDWRRIIFTEVTTIGTMVLAGLYAPMTQQGLSFFPALGTLDQNWLIGTTTILLISLVTLGSIISIISELNKTLARQSKLADELRQEQASLETRIQERTRDIETRLVQIRTAAEINRYMAEITDPDQLLRQTVELIRERFDLYYVGVFLLDDAGEYAVLEAGTGEAGRAMRAAGHRLATGGQSMIGWCISNRKSRIALDVGSEAVRFSNPNLPQTRSELALPMIAQNQVLGAMTVQSVEADAFDEDDIAVLTALASGLSVSLQNDFQFRETRRRLEETRVQNRAALQDAWGEILAVHGNRMAYDYLDDDAPVPQEAHMLEMPVQLRGETIGMIRLEAGRGELTADEAAFVESITNQTAVALESARLLEDSERRALQEQKMSELTARFSRAISIDEILRTAAEELGHIPMVNEVTVRLNPLESLAGGTNPAQSGGDGSNGHANGRSASHAA